MVVMMNPGYRLSGPEGDTGFIIITTREVSFLLTSLFMSRFPSVSGIFIRCSLDHVVCRDGETGAKLTRHSPLMIKNNRMKETDDMKPVSSTRRLITLP